MSKNLLYDLTKFAIVDATGHAFYRTKVYGRENLPEEGHVIIANHSSWLIEGAIIISALRRKIHFIVRNLQATKSPYFRPLTNYLRRVDQIVIGEGSSDISKENISRAIEEAKEAIANGEIVGVFPEGKISNNGEINEFKGAAGLIAYKTESCIVPVYTRGIERLWHPYKFPRPFQDIEVIVGKPIPPDKRRTHRGLMEVVRQEVINLSRRT